MLARMAGIVQKAEDHFKELMDKETDSKLKEKFDRKKLNMASYRDNFIYLAGQQRGKDKDVLRFFVRLIICVIFFCHYHESFLSVSIRIFWRNSH